MKTWETRARHPVGEMETLLISDDKRHSDLSTLTVSLFSAKLSLCSDFLTTV